VAAFFYNVITEGVQFMLSTKPARGVLLTAVFAILVASLPALHAQQRGRRGGAPETPATPAAPAVPGAAAAPVVPAKPIVPVAANTVATHPDPYYGEVVTMTASVNEMVSKSSLLVGQKTVGDAAKAKGVNADVLVLLPTMYGAVDLNAYVTVMGEVVKFDPVEIAKKSKNYKLDEFTPEVVEKYKGRPVVLATAVINAASVDLTKRLPPPMTTDEEALQKVMRKVAPAFAALRTSIDTAKADIAAQNVAVLKEAFADTEAFWKSKGKADATGWAADARKQVDLIDHAVAAGKLDDAKVPNGTLGQSCTNCHGAYRERFDDGSFRIKTSK
jgi:cytochrome c556